MSWSATSSVSRPPLLVILGPTACGKTRLSLDLARLLPCEIISADSAQVYRGMDIGTDKPSAAEMVAVPHHLVGIRDPHESFHVADFQRLAAEAARDIAGRGRLPVVVGGTGLYIRALVTGYALSPQPADPGLRERLALEAAEAGSDALHARLAAVDPAAAARIHPHNVRRVIRALEVYHLAGAPLTALEGRVEGAGPFEALLVGLIRDRDDLYRRIEDRVENQLARGLVAEVAALLERYPPHLQAFQALGYKEVIAHLRGEVDFPTMVATLKHNTRRYAKRQETWFRREEGLRWFNLTHEPVAIVLANVLNLVRQMGWA